MPHSCVRGPRSDSKAAARRRHAVQESVRGCGDVSHERKRRLRSRTQTGLRPDREGLAAPWRRSGDSAHEEGDPCARGAPASGEAGDASQGKLEAVLLSKKPPAKARKRCGARDGRGPARLGDGRGLLAAERRDSRRRSHSSSRAPRPVHDADQGHRRQFAANTSAPDYAFRKCPLPARVVVLEFSLGPSITLLVERRKHGDELTADGFRTSRSRAGSGSEPVRVPRCRSGSSRRR